MLEHRNKRQVIAIKPRRNSAKIHLLRGYLSLAGQDRRHPAEHGEHGVTQPALQDEGAQAEERNQQGLDRLGKKKQVQRTPQRQEHTSQGSLECTKRVHAETQALEK